MCVYNQLFKIKFQIIAISLHPFLANIPILHSLKTPENQRFSGVLRECKIGTLARNELLIFKLFRLDKSKIKIKVTA